MPDEIKTDPYAGNDIITEQVLRGTRKFIANSLMESYRNKIHASSFKYLEIKTLREFKEKLQKGSIVDHFIRAVALSLAQKPELNATYENGIYRMYRDVNVAYAVSTKRGLVTPVLRKADTLDLSGFMQNRKYLISEVMDWKHQVSDLLGGTFTITNMGNFGIDFTHPIINPPQIAILGMARICRLSISWDASHDDSGIIEPKELLPVSLTYDHSVIDGAAVAEFLQVLQDKVNNPETLWNS